MAPDGHSLIASVALAEWVDLAARAAGRASDFRIGRHCGQRQVHPRRQKAVLRDRQRVSIRLCDAAGSRFGSLTSSLERRRQSLRASRRSTTTSQPDGQQVVIEALDADRRFRLYLAPLDRRSTGPTNRKRRGTGSHDSGPTAAFSFARQGLPIASARTEPALRKAIEQPVLLLNGISPDGRWLVAWSPLPGENAVAYQAFSLSGDSLDRNLARHCLELVARRPIRCRFQMVLFQRAAATLFRFRQARCSRKLPAGGLRSEEDVAQLPARVASTPSCARPVTRRVRVLP